MKTLEIVILASGLSLVASCGNAPKKGPSSVQNPPPNNGGATAPTFTSLQSSLFTPFCVSCHGAATRTAGIALDTYADAKAAVTPDDHQPIIIAGDSNDSPIFQALSTGEMPPSGPKPTPDVVASLKAWIDAGAKPAQ